MKPKIVAVTAQDVAAFLAKKPRKRRNALRKVKHTEKLENITDDFVRNFSARELFAALKDKRGRSINIRWYVEKLLEALKGAGKASEKVLILDRFKELMLIGAIQDRDLAEHLTKTIPELADTKPAEQFDPFLRGRLKTVG